MDPDRDLAGWQPRLLAMARELLGHGKPQGPHGPQARPKAQSDRLEPGERKILGRAIERLSLGLTRERALVGQRYLDDPTLLAGYLLFYWPISYAQVCSLLGELPKPTTVLDLGSGPGPASFAMLDAGATRVLAADRSGPALAIAAKLASMRGVPLHTQRWKPDMPLPPGKFSMIVAQHLLNELWPGDEALVRRAALCRDLLGRLEPHGTLLLVEPALRDTSRELLQLRDVLVREGIAVRAPCLYRGDCQALDRPSDWCHAERDWTPPPLVLELAQAAGLRKERLKMSYLALAPPGEPWTEPPPGRLFRIVSEPLQGKGRLRYMACGPEGRMGLALQDKHVTDANRHFAALERGEIVSIEGAAAKGDGLGLDAASQVTRVAGPGERINDGRRPPRPGSES